jgi:hypothetical protein
VLARFLPLLVLLALAPLLRGAASLDHARRAQALLGPEVWSQVIEVENTAGGGSRYPAIVHALVFEFAGILWFYSDADGTQSFSLHQGRLAEEKADFAPLLREIDPGFARWAVRPEIATPASETAPALAPPAEPLRNGCFIESVAAWRRRVACGEETRAPRLLAYYFPPGAAKAGHTVLAFEAQDRIEVFDPARPAARFSFARRTGADALALARALDGKSVSKARFLALPDAPPTAVAAGPAPRVTAPAGA